VGAIHRVRCLASLHLRVVPGGQRLRWATGNGDTWRTPMTVHAETLMCRTVAEQLRAEREAADRERQRQLAESDRRHWAEFLRHRGK
jgi:hypothetical protein